MAKDNRSSATRSGAETLADELRRAMRKGEYTAGQRLVEQDLCQHFAAGRGRVREALRLLAAEGVVVIETNRGASVRKLGPREVVQLYQVREVMEGLAARLCAEAGPDSQTREMLDDLRREMSIAEKNGDISHYLDRNEAFHSYLVTASGNGFIAQTLDTVRLRTFRIQFQIALDRSIIGESNRQHERIISAILQGNAVDAERAMRSHVRDSFRMVSELEALSDQIPRSL